MADKKCWKLASGAYQQAHRVSASFNGDSSLSTLLLETRWADMLRENGDKRAGDVYLDLISRVPPQHLQDPESRSLIAKNVADSLYQQNEFSRALPYYANAIRYLKVSAPVRSNHAANISDDDVPGAEKLAICFSHLAECEYRTASATDSKKIGLAAQDYAEACKYWLQCRAEQSYDVYVTALEAGSNTAQAERQRRSSQSIQPGSCRRSPGLWAHKRYLRNRSARLC